MLRHGLATRALVGNLEPVARLGMTRVLEEGGLEVVGGGLRAEALVNEVRELQPDAIVLGFDAGDGSELRERVQAAAPEAKVILWARDETEMTVYEPGTARPRYVHAPPSEALLRELKTRRVRERE